MRKTHGHTVGYKKTKLYKLWKGMRERCRYEKHKAYKYYGGRGIVVCDEWQDFSVFLLWATASDYKEGLTLDRRNNNGNYEPSNCRWVTRKEQSNNRSSNVLLTYEGLSLTIVQWAAKKLIPEDCLFQRLNRYTWPIDKALTFPVRKGNNQYATI